jgi:cytochrome c peroxidase
MAGPEYWWVCVLGLASCWSSTELAGDSLTPEQLAALRTRFATPEVSDVCPLSSNTILPGNCPQAAELGHALFFDPSLSSTGKVSCATCHDPAHWYADGRTENAVSLGDSAWTKRNTISVVNLGLKPVGTFSWVGLPVPADVITQIALPKAMAATPQHVSDAIAQDPGHLAAYEALFGTRGSDAVAVTYLASLALEAYMRSLTSIDSPFDRFVAGDDGAMSQPAIRGFGVFVGRGMCIECHRGPLLSDGSFHVTGVPQEGAHAPLVDTGRDQTGMFLTAGLRNIEQTAPYMHDGSLATLAEVVDFYRWGGGISGYPKDRFMEPLEIDDRDASDLVAFLRSLTGSPIDATLSAPLGPTP